MIWRIAQAKSPKPVRFGTCSAQVMGFFLDVHTDKYKDVEKQWILCFDRGTGKQLWQTVVHKGNLMRSHRKNSFASATPACDGRHVFAAFINDGQLWVTALDFAGEIVWQKPAGRFEPEHGYGSSPVLYRSAVIVNGDNAHASFVAALDRAFYGARRVGDGACAGATALPW